MNPSWYDILDVEPTASAEAIRAAWKSAIADLDPADRRFRVRNDAAAVLLDPQQRAAYDVELAAQVPEAVLDEPGEPVSATSVDLTKPHSETEIHAPTSLEIQHLDSTDTRRVVPGWLLAGVAIVTAVAVGVTAWLWFSDSDESVESATRAAQSAAETAVVPILSYDAKHLDRDQAAAQSYMTTGFQKKYDPLFAGVVAQNAPSTGTKVAASFVSSAIVRAGADRVQILVFVDQSRTNKVHRQPVVFKNYVTLTMEKVGDDWLVDDMQT